MEYWKNISKDGKVDSYPHSVLFAAANSESLLYHTKAAILKDEIVDWLNDNIGNDMWQFYNIGLIGFKSEEDAMGFILRWS